MRPDVESLEPDPAVWDDKVDTQELEEDVEFHALLQRTRLTTPLTRALLVVVVLGVGFLAGAIVQKHRQPASNAASLPAQLAQLFGGANLPGATTGAPGGASGDTVTGTVKLVDGDNVYVQDAQGTIVKVTTTGATKVTVTKPGTSRDLDPATSVTVHGTKGPDGSFAATEISPGATSAFPSGALPSGAPSGATPPGGG